MIIKNNFIRLCVGLNLLLCSLFVESKELDYKFYWLSLPVAKLSINFNEPLYTNNIINRSDIKFQLSTQGPLKLYRNYLSEGSIKDNPTNNSSWDYYLFGQDRGQPEKKLITYFSDSAPKIKIFIDDTGFQPITVNSFVDKGAIDPFSVLLKTIQQLNIEQKCNSTYFVMDGKRRYKAKLNFIGKENLNMDKKRSFKGDTHHCQLRVLSNEVANSGVMKNHWPFNGGKKVVDIWFAEGMNFQPVKFQFKAPLGRIIGRLVLE
jgi:hypothetical protein